MQHQPAAFADLAAALSRSAATGRCIVQSVLHTATEVWTYFRGRPGQRRPGISRTDAAGATRSLSGRRRTAAP
eukprot:2969681-Lingulodinium_polyedra.AAC.1